MQISWGQGGGNMEEGMNCKQDMAVLGCGENISCLDYGGSFTGVYFVKTHQITHFKYVQFVLR